MTETRTSHACRIAEERGQPSREFGWTRATLCSPHRLCHCRSGFSRGARVGYLQVVGAGEDAGPVS